MPRPRKPGALTSTERATLSRQRRQVQPVGLPGPLLAELDAIRAETGDASRAAVIARLVAERRDRPA